MGYYDDKVPYECKPNPAALAGVMAEWIEELQDELRKAGRQVDRLERKILRRSQSLGEARKVANDVIWKYVPPAPADPTRGGGW
jgi:hypothetical protein